MKTEKLVLNRSQNTEIAVACIKCDGVTVHAVLLSADLDGQDTSDGYDERWNKSYQTIQCLGCKSVSLRTVTSSSEDYFTDEDGDVQHFEDEKLYPPRLVGRKGLGYDRWKLPDTVRRMYDETCSAHLAGLPVLAGVGLRAIIEAICIHENAKGDSLLKRIDDLQAKGKLTPAGASVLHKVRSLGNKAAHEASPHTAGQLSLAMDIAEHLLKDVYVLPKLAASVFAKESPPEVAVPVLPICNNREA